MTPGPPAGRRPVSRRELLIAAAGLLVVVVIGKALSAGSDRPSAHMSSSVAPTVARPNGPVALPPPAGGDVTACPTQVRCAVQEAGDGLALEPVRSRLPKAEVTRFHSVLLEAEPWSGRLWYRELAFRLPDGSSLQIRISVRLQTTSAQAGHVGTQSFAIAPLGRYVVRVTAPQSLGLRPDVLPGIAGDERLLTT